MKDETLETKMREAAWIETTADNRLVTERDAIRIAREHAEARVGPLVALLRQAYRQCKCPPNAPVSATDGLDCWCGAAKWNIELRAALSAEQAHAEATTTQDAGREPGSGGN